MEAAPTLVAAAGFAILLGSALAAKLRDRHAFAAVLADYKLLPRALVGPVGYAVAALEGILAVAWLAAPWRADALWIAAAGTAGMLVVYGLAITANLLRGRTWIDCGCGGGEQLSWGLVVRNGVLASLALAPLGIVDAGAPGWRDAAVALPVLVICVGLYLAVGTLLDNASTMREWRGA